MTDFLVTDHAEVGALFGELLATFDGEGAGELLAKLDYVWARLAVHIRAEHLHLFPALLSAAEGAAAGSGAPSPPEVRESVERLREDHDFFMRELAGAVNGTRALVAGGSVPDAVRLGAIRDMVLAVAGRLSEHNRLEEEQVYLWQAALLGEDSRAGLRRKVKRELENLPPRFSGSTNERANSSS